MDNEIVRKYQLTQIELLETTDKICQELGIDYYMIGGTLLGAVRHGGFIPWDADIDIAMRRDDYEKFRQYWANTDSDRYFYDHYSTEKNHLSPHALLRLKDTHIKMKGRKTEKYVPAYDGIYLDIFPLDDAPVDDVKKKKQMQKIKRIKSVIELKAAYRYSSTGWVKMLAKKLVQLLLVPVSLTKLNCMLDNTMKKYNGSGSGYIVSMASHYSYWKQLMKDEIYGKSVRIKFEDYEFCAPAMTEKYLTQLFGDYMKLPPENKRYSDLDNIESIDCGGGIIING